MAIAANTTYVAAYLAPNGHYSDTASAFTAGGASNPPLSALANSTSPNGVYSYSATSTFPTSNYKATNYWVDVDFEPTPTTTPGQVTNVTATAGPGSAGVTWSAPSSGSPATSYTITPYAVTPTATRTTPVTDAHVTVNGHGAVTTPSFSTVEAGEQLLAFVASDGPSGAAKQSATVSGAAFTWTLVKRANSRSGDAEIWTAEAKNELSNVTVTSTPAVAGYDQSPTVISMQGSNGSGASVAGGATSGAPSVSLTTEQAGSLVYAVGSDWDNATARTLGPIRHSCARMSTRRAGTPSGRSSRAPSPARRGTS